MEKGMDLGGNLEVKNDVGLSSWIAWPFNEM